MMGLNISEFQVGKRTAYNEDTGLGGHCSVLQDNFMDMPAEDRGYSAVIHIEGTPHVPKKTAVYAEMLRPDAPCAGYSRWKACVWCPEDRSHRDTLKRLVDSIVMSVRPPLLNFHNNKCQVQILRFQQRLEMALVKNGNQCNTVPPHQIHPLFKCIPDQVSMKEITVGCLSVSLQNRNWCSLWELNQTKQSTPHCGATPVSEHKENTSA